MEQIFDSAIRCPIPIRKICQEIKETVEQKFPESVYLALGNFLFLRFICSAIITPSNFSIDIHYFSGPKMARLFLLVTKIIQNIANMTHFRQQCFLDFNTLIDEYKPKLIDFYNNILMFIDNDYNFHFRIPHDLIIDKMDYLIKFIVDRKEEIKEKATMDIEDEGKKINILKILAIVYGEMQFKFITLMEYLPNDRLKNTNLTQLNN